MVPIYHLFKDTRCYAVSVIILYCSNLLICWWTSGLDKVKAKFIKPTLMIYFELKITGTNVLARIFDFLFNISTLKV